MNELELNKIIDDYFVNFSLEKKTELLENINYDGFDFYITDINLHIEYIGMINCSNLEIKTNYEDRIKIKKDICLEYNINCLFSSDISEIIKYIKYEIENKNV